MLDLSGGPCLIKRVTGCGAGNEYVAVTPSGDIYPCHQFAGNPETRMGSVLDGTFDIQAQKKYKECNVLNKEECSRCWAKYYCSEMCIRDSLNRDNIIFSEQPNNTGVLIGKSVSKDGRNIVLKEQLSLGDSVELRKNGKSLGGGSVYSIMQNGQAAKTCSGAARINSLNIKEAEGALVLDVYKRQFFDFSICVFILKSSVFYILFVNKL